MGKRVHWLAGSEVTFLDCALQHCADGSQSVEAFQFSIDARIGAVQTLLSFSKEKPVDL